MKNNWILVEIELPGALVDIVAAVLAEHDCQGTVVEARTLDTFVVPDDELLAEQLYTIKSYFDATVTSTELVERIRSDFSELPVLAPWSGKVVLVGPVKNEDWAQNWKQNFSSFKIGEKLLFKPSWEEVEVAGDVRVIEIDPGMAFGTGTHGTTRLCLEAIAELFEAQQPPATLLDVGTGSGILALGAAALGCQKVLGNDLDPLACEVARSNVAINGYSRQVEITEQPLEQLEGQFDMVVANILAEENVRLKQSLFDHTAEGGWLVLSGILREKEEFVRNGFADLALKVFPTRYQDEWVCMVYQRQG